MLVLFALLSISGASIVYGYALSVKAKVYQIGELGAKDIGTIVSVNGHIKEMSVSQNNNVNLRLIDISNGAEILVFVPNRVYENFQNKADLLPGSEVKIEGYVEEYRGSLEIVVSGSDKIILLHEVKDNKISLQTLLESPDIYSSMTVNVTGTLTKPDCVMNYNRIEVIDREETSRRIWVSIEKKVDYVNRMVGDTVDVFGCLRYFPYRGEGRWEIVVSASEDNITSIHSPLPPGFAEVTLTGLFNALESFEGMNVALRGVRVMSTSELVGTTFTIENKYMDSTFSLDCIIYSLNVTNDMNGRNIVGGEMISFLGKFGYYPPKGCWQLSSKMNTVLVL